jgi:hypothetical protein
MRFPQPALHPQAYQPHHYIVRSTASSPLRAVLARVQRPQRPRR